MDNNYYLNHTTQTLEGGCGGIEVTDLPNNSEMLGGNSSSINAKPKWVVPSGLVCIPNFGEYCNEKQTTEFCIPSEHAISDSRFDQLLKRASAPIPDIFTKTLNIFKEPAKILSRKHSHVKKQRTQRTKNTI